MALTESYRNPNVRPFDTPEANRNHPPARKKHTRATVTGSSRFNLGKIHASGTCLDCTNSTVFEEMNRGTGRLVLG